MTTSKPTLYEFAGSCWANAPKLALSETGYKKGDVEWKSINLAEGANFDPEYLKINKNGTVPTLVIDGKTVTDSSTVVSELVKRAPHPPQAGAATSTSLIEEIHGEAHDPNATLLFARDDKDREAKINGLPKAFLEGRQKALDKLAPSAPSEFKSFLEQKQKGNKQLYDFFATDVDETAKKAHYAQANELWKSVGILLRGPITQAIQKSGGPFAAGSQPGEVDYHLITWLSRTITNTGVEPGSPSSVAIPRLKEYTGGHEIDPVIAKYWDAWVARESFKDNSIH